MSIYSLETVMIAKSYMRDRVGSATFHYDGDKALVNIAISKPSRKLTKPMESMRMDIINFQYLAGYNSDFDLPNFISYVKPRDLDTFYKTLTLLIMRYPELTDEEIEYKNKVNKAREKIMSMNLSR